MKHFIQCKGLLLALLLFTVGTAACQTGGKSFKGLNNEEMIQTLKNFPSKPARWNVPAEDGRLLYDIIKENNYSRVLEVGTSNGYSALWMGFALKATGGELITLEINNERGNEAKNNIADAGLDDIIEVRINDAMEAIPELEGEFDFVFLDANKSGYLDYYKMIKSRLKPGGTIAAHNASSMQYAMQDFIDAIRADPAFNVTINEATSQGTLIATKNAGGE